MQVSLEKKVLLSLHLVYTYFVAVDVENKDVQFEMAVYITDFL